MKNLALLSLLAFILCVFTTSSWGETVISIELGNHACGWSDWKEGTAFCSSNAGDVDIINGYSDLGYGSISVVVEVWDDISEEWDSFYSTTNNGSPVIATGQTITMGTKYRMKWAKYSNPHCPSATVSLGFDPSNCPD